MSGDHDCLSCVSLAPILVSPMPLALAHSVTFGPDLAGELHGARQAQASARSCLLRSCLLAGCLLLSPVSPRRLAAAPRRILVLTLVLLCKYLLKSASIRRDLADLALRPAYPLSLGRETDHDAEDIEMRDTMEMKVFRTLELSKRLKHGLVKKRPGRPPWGSHTQGAGKQEAKRRDREEGE